LIPKVEPLANSLIPKGAGIFFNRPGSSTFGFLRKTSGFGGRAPILQVGCALEKASESSDQTNLVLA
jgi:hypothetical protein